MQSERPARPASPTVTAAQPATSAPEAAPSAEPVSTLLPPQLAATALAGREVSDTWSGLKPVRPGPKSLFAALGHDCDGPVAREFDILRTEVLQVLRSEGWKRIGVVAPHAGCGTTFTAINLACGLARVEQFRTLLVDLNQRAPGLHKALDLPWRGNIADLLEGDYHAAQYARAYSDTLALLLNAATSPASADLLHRARTAVMLEDIYLSLDPGVVVFDLPPLLDYDDLSAFAPNLDAVLLVASAETTTSAEILDCERKLSGHVPLLGVVLNKTKQARP
ncbi:MAG TPA: exopolysaccharide biosynthesis protein [Rhodobacterales bacterium]|nr:exopolysaccharide biosynthesis protein [Rhodobacterales bacterium]